MTIVVDPTGLGSPRGNSYVTIAAFVAFYGEGGRADTVVDNADEEQIEAALKMAADYMAQTWRLRWLGSRADAYQPLDWPRRGVPIIDFFDPWYSNANVLRQFQNTVYLAENVFPPEVEKCQMYLARVVLGTSGLATTPLQANLERMTKREKVGELEVEYMTAEEGGYRQVNYYYEAERIILPFLRPASYGRVVRS